MMIEALGRIIDINKEALNLDDGNLVVPKLGAIVCVCIWVGGYCNTQQQKKSNLFIIYPT